MDDGLDRFELCYLCGFFCSFILLILTALMDTKNLDDISCGIPF